MLSEREKTELFDELKNLRNEVIELKGSLNRINREKEKFFREKEKLSKTISTSISEVRETRSERDKLTADVRKNKEKRKKYSDDVNRRIEDVKRLKRERDSIKKKHNIKGDPSSIKREIEKIEEKIETSVIPFETEKALLKRVKELQKAYKEALAVSSVWEKIHDTSKNIDDSWKHAKDAHSRVQNEARESQAKHEELIETSKQIDRLKKGEADAFLKFIEQKKKFNEVNNQLKDKLMMLNDINAKLEEYRTETRQEKKKREMKMLKEGSAKVKEKIKRGGKLTTEDLLVFQGAGES